MTTPAQRPYKRKLVNFLIDPLFQFRFASQILGILCVFSLVFGGFAYLLIRLLYGTFDMVEVDQSFVSLVNEQVFQIVTGMIVTAIAFFAITIAFVIIETHKIVGAKYAIMKYFREYLFKGNYGMCLRLRRRDYFQDLAEVLNKFVVQVGDKKD